MIVHRDSARELRFEYMSHCIRDSLEMLGVDFVEGRELSRVEVQNGLQGTVRPQYRYHDLRSASRVAGDVPFEGVNIGDDLSSQSSGGCTANPFSELDLETAHRALIGTYTQQPGSDYAIKADPAGCRMDVVHERSNARHRGDGVGKPFQERLDLRRDPAIFLHLVFGHREGIVA